MGQDMIEEIEGIMGSMKCAYDYNCYKRALKPLCKMVDVGMDCVRVEKNGGNGCGYLAIEGEDHYCRCPLYVFLAKNVFVLPH